MANEYIKLLEKRDDLSDIALTFHKIIDHCYHTYPSLYLQKFIHIGRSEEDAVKYMKARSNGDAIFFLAIDSNTNINRKYYPQLVLVYHLHGDTLALVKYVYGDNAYLNAHHKYCIKRFITVDGKSVDCGTLKLSKD